MERAGQHWETSTVIKRQDLSERTRKSPVFFVVFVVVVVVVAVVAAVLPFLENVLTPRFTKRSQLETWCGGWNLRALEPGVPGGVPGVPGVPVVD